MIIKNKVCFVYDIEVFPNFFSIAIKNTESGNIKNYQICQWQNDLGEIIKLFLNQNIIRISYNGLDYDDPIINLLIINFSTLNNKPIWEINAAIKQLSDEIVNSKDNNFSSWSKYKYAHLFESLDLLAMRFSQKLRVSLKEMQVTMQYKNVEEYSGDFEIPILKDDISQIVAYNINDVESTEELLKRSIQDIQLRLAIEEEFGISALNKDGVNLGMEIIKSKYLQATGFSWKDIRDLRSPCDSVCFKDIIFSFIEFKTPVLQNLLSDLKSLCVDPNDNSFERTFVLGGVKHTFGMGGIHSVNTPEIFEPSDDEVLGDFDVNSMYPSIVCSQQLFPKHLGPIFVQVYNQIRLDRLTAKKNGDKIKNETYKLALNGLTGNLQSPYSWVYDPEMVLKIRINGQLMLLMLAEAFSELGCRIVQSNTDGTFILYKKKQQKAVLEACSEWEQKTGLTLEADYFERFYQYAINDYLGIKKGWRDTHDPKFIKTKGLFIDKVSLGKGMAPMIVAEAINKYFIEGKDPKTTLKECKDILKFCTYQKVAKDFTVEYNNKVVRHINRYYMSTNGARIIKYKLENGEKIRPTNLCADSGVTLYNKFDNLPIEERHINYQYYLHEIYKIIYAIEDSLNPTLF